MKYFRIYFIVCLINVFIFCDGSPTDCPHTDAISVDSVFAMDSQMFQIEWIGKEDLVVFALSEGGHLYRSGDDGKTWHNESQSKLQGVGQVSSDLYGRSGVARIFHHPGRPDEVMFVGRNGQHWVSYDKGASYVQPCGFETSGQTCIQHPGGDATMKSIPYIKLHPSKKSSLLAMTRRDACYSDARDCAEDLWLSQDFGQHWRNLTAQANGRIVGFVDFDWANEEDDHLHILATVYRQHSHLKQRTYTSWDKNVDLVRTKDFFATEEAELPCGNAFKVINEKVFAAVTVDCNKEDKKYASPNVQLRISEDHGMNFHPVCFPVEIEDKDYTILDVVQKAAFVCVDHDEEDGLEASAPVANMYTSDSTLELFGLSQRRIFRPHSFTTDFVRVQSIPATMMINQVDESALSDPLIFDGEADFDEYLVTKISFTEGASWETLKAPEKDSLGNDVACRDAECSLQLHGPSSWYKWASEDDWFPAYYSHDNAPGVVMAVGNTGPFLEHDPNKISTYLSRDGGQSWVEVRKKPHIYEFGDHGGIILIAEHASSGPTDEFFFSRDEGLCWEGPLRLKDHAPLNVENIRVEPKSRSSVFIAHGRGIVDGRVVTKLITIDVRQLLGEDRFPMCKEDDYEFWSPTLSHCLLGQNFTLERRKQDSRCFNGFDYERRDKGELGDCKCTHAQDVQCLYGFARFSGAPAEPCEFQPEEDFNATCPINIGDRNWKDTGEAIVPADQCTDPGAVVENAKTRRAKAKASKGISGGMIFLIIFLVFLSAGIVLFLVRNYLPEPFSEKVNEICVTMLDFMEQTKEFILSKLNIDTVSYNRMQEHFQPLAGVADEENFHIDDEA